MYREAPVRQIHAALALQELAALVCSTLERHGVSVVLSGGSLVSIHSNNAYQSYDLDFIQTGLARKVDAAMEELGFTKQGRHWTHSESPYLVEFPPGPIMVGDARVTEFAERITPLGGLTSPRTDGVCDGSQAAYYHWNDPQGLDQPLLRLRSTRSTLLV